MKNANMKYFLMNQFSLLVKLLSFIKDQIKNALGQSDRKIHKSAISQELIDE